MSLIIIKPTSMDSTQLYYAVLDKDNPEATLSLGDWEHVKRVLRKRKVILFVPSEDVLLLPATIPSRNNKQLKQAIPFAIEDMLADDIDDLHFSFHATDDAVNVAVIQKHRLTDWIEWVKKQGVSLHAVLPDVLGLPITEQGWTLQEQASPLGQARLFVRKNAYEGFVCPLAIAENLLANDLANETTIQRLSIDSNELFEGMIAAHASPDIELNNASQGLNFHAISDALPLNLLTGIRQESHHPIEWKQWRMAAVLAVMTLSTWLGLVYYENTQLQKQLTAKNEQIEAIYKNTFPNEKRVVDAKAQMEQKLKALQGSTQLNSNNTPLPLLAKLSPKLAATITVNSINFNQNQGLSLALDASALNDLDQLNTVLKQDATLNATLETSVVSGKAQGKLTLKNQ